MRSDVLLVECKRTDNARQITLKLKDLEKIRLEAIDADRIPALELDLNNHKWVIIPRGWFEEMVEKCKSA